MLKTAYQQSPKQELAKNTPFFNETDLKHSFIIDFENQEFIHHQAEPLNYLLFNQRKSENFKNRTQWPPIHCSVFNDR